MLKNFKTEKKSSALYTAARKIESILSSIAVYAKDHNYHKIIVAGGETSGVEQKHCASTLKQEIRH